MQALSLRFRRTAELPRQPKASLERAVPRHWRTSGYVVDLSLQRVSRETKRLRTIRSNPHKHWGLADSRTYSNLLHRQVGIKCVLSIVYRIFSDRHPWIILPCRAQQSLSKPHPSKAAAIRSCSALGIPNLWASVRQPLMAASTALNAAPASAEVIP